MKKLNNKSWFTLVELLVVITILTIISVVAYQNFWGATDKAVAWRKINDVATLEKSLIQYKSIKNYYPSTWVYTSTWNLWGYDKTKAATQSNTLKVSMSGNEIASVVSADWWWKINDTNSKQIWAKGTVWKAELWQQFLSTDLYDPEVWDVKLTDWTKLIDKWIGRYVYWVYKKSNNWNSTNQLWTAFNIAYTLKKEWSEDYVTKIVWDYSQESCWEWNTTCPKTLIGSSTTVLKDWDTSSWSIKTSTDWDQMIPYSVTDFAQ